MIFIIFGISQIQLVDGKHIRLKCPPNSGTMYYNYKQSFSIVLQAIADAHRKFIIAEIGEYGKQSDDGNFCFFRNVWVKKEI